MTGDNTQTIYKSAVDGKIVSKEYAEANPSTTYATTVDTSPEVEPQPAPDEPDAVEAS